MVSKKDKNESQMRPSRHDGKSDLTFPLRLSKQSSGGSKIPGIGALLSTHRGRKKGNGEKSKARVSTQTNKQKTKTASAKKPRSWLLRRLSPSSKAEDRKYGLIDQMPRENIPNSRFNPRENSLLDMEHDGPWIYDETSAAAGRLTLIYQGGINEDITGSDNSLLLEILTESSGTSSVPPSLFDFASDGFTALSRDISALAKMGENRAAAMHIDASESSRTDSTSSASTTTSSSPEDEGQKVRKPLHRSRKSSSSSCSQDVVLDCAEFSMSVVSNAFWTMDMLSQSFGTKHDGKNKEYQTNATPQQCGEASRSRPWFGVPVAVDTEEEETVDKLNDSKALKAMLDRALKDGSVLVSSTLGSIRQVASEMTEDPLAPEEEDDEDDGEEECSKHTEEPPNESSCCRDPNYARTASPSVVIGEYLVATNHERTEKLIQHHRTPMYRVLDHQRNASPRDSKRGNLVIINHERPKTLIQHPQTPMDRVLDHRKKVIRSASSEWRDEASWEAFQDTRNRTRSSHKDRETVYWSTEPDMPDDERRALDEMESLSMCDR